MSRNLSLNDHIEAAQEINRLLDEHEFNECNVNIGSKCEMPSAISITVKDKDGVYVTMGRMNYIDVRVTEAQYAAMMLEQGTELIQRLSNIVNTRH